MPARIYAAPTKLGEPPAFDDERFRDADGRFDFNAHWEAEEEWIETVKAAAKARHPRSKVVGQEYATHVGDGAARYVVWDTKPLTLIHLPVGDAWNMSEIHARGLRVSDVTAYCTAPSLFGEAS
jgi:hypothetical protein